MKAELFARVWGRLGVLLVPITALLVLGGCSETLEIPVPEATVSFKLDVGAITAGVDLPTVEDDGEGVREFDVEVAQGFNVELTALEPRLEDYRGAVDSIEIKRISYRVKKNSLTQDLGPVGIYFGELDKTEPGEGVAKYGETGRIVGGVESDDWIDVEVADPPHGADAVSEYLTMFDFSNIMSITKIYYDPAHGHDGVLELELQLELSFHVNVADTLSAFFE